MTEAPPVYAPARALWALAVLKEALGEMGLASLDYTGDVNGGKGTTLADVFDARGGLETIGPVVEAWHHVRGHPGCCVHGHHAPCPDCDPFIYGGGGGRKDGTTEAILTAGGMT